MGVEDTVSHRSSRVVEGPLWLSTVDAKQVVRQAHHERRLGNADASHPVFPAKARIQKHYSRWTYLRWATWIPACAGKTGLDVGGMMQ